jgi:GntR family transcriptional repressor for pyruvate dehydrogenase complex
MKPAIIKAREPLHREVARILSERIISGDCPERSLLPTERELCKDMGVSRTVIREAIKFLESRGLVRIERGRGTVVQEPHAGPLTETFRLLLRRRGDVLKDLVEVRKILEVGIAGLAAERRDESHLRGMERALETMRQKPSAPEGYVDADVAFHAEIARASQNPVVLVLLEPLADLLRESRLITFSGPRMVKLRTRQHEQIYKRIRAGDAEGAREAMGRHLTDTEKDLARHRSSSPKDRKIHPG